MPTTRIVSVFTDGAGGGNPAPIVTDGLVSDEQMQRIAREHGLETAFVVAAEDPDCDLALRFWVPNHEMTMCGHATLGAVWLLWQDGLFADDSELRVQTLSGVVRARIGGGRVSVSQPPATVEAVDDPGAVAAVLGLQPGDLADLPILNSTTSRTKTLVPLRTVATLDALRPHFDDMESVCARIGSTGLYPYAPSGDARFDARQFPASSGYPEDAATGVAAAALLFGLRTSGQLGLDVSPITVRQGRAMGRPSSIGVELDGPASHPDGCWLSGEVVELAL